MGVVDEAFQRRARTLGADVEERGIRHGGKVVAHREEATKGDP